MDRIAQINRLAKQLYVKFTGSQGEGTTFVIKFSHWFRFNFRSPLKRIPFASPALLLLTVWGCSALGHGFRFRRWRGAPELRSDAIARPQLGALDGSDEFAALRFFRLHLYQRLVADLWRRTLTECGC
jgi:hypothetical protein